MGSSFIIATVGGNRSCRTFVPGMVLASGGSGGSGGWCWPQGAQGDGAGLRGLKGDGAGLSGFICFTGWVDCSEPVAPYKENTEFLFLPSMCLDLGRLPF